MGIAFLIFALVSHEQQRVETEHHPAHWSYEGATGPEHWGELSSEYSVCKTGREQSPIDISHASVANLAPIEFNYSATSLRVINNGHTIQVTSNGNDFISIAGTRYQLVQFHFHHPSEEQIEGKTHVLVVHLVHQDHSGRKAVVAVLFDLGESNPAIKTIFDNLPRVKNQEITSAATVNPENLLPAVRGYYTFSGSLTTPPCSEGVTWFVLKHPVTLSRSELAKFSHLYPNNTRPVQPLNGRTVLSTR